MMGVGKSTIGRVLSKKLNMRFIDIDVIIQKKEKMTINKIFKSKGEEYFRGLEKSISLDNLEKKNVIIALGGGAFINPIIRNKVLKNCISIWLNVDLVILNSRLQRTSRRPLLNNSNKTQTLNKIYNERKNIYKLANFKVDCDSLDRHKIIEEILNIYENT